MTRSVLYKQNQFIKYGILCFLTAFFVFVSGEGNKACGTWYQTTILIAEAAEMGKDEGDWNEDLEQREEEIDSLMEDFQFETLQDFLDHTEEESRLPFTFKELLKELMKGNFTGIFHECLASVKDHLFSEIQKNGKWMGQVLALGLIGALFANFSSIFTSSQISETGFYVTYLLMFVFLASSFLSGVSITKEILENLLEFMRALLPAYFLAISFAGGSLTSAAGYGLMLLSISLVEWLFLRICLPMIRVYLLLALAGNLVKEEMFSQMMELLESGIRWGIKTAAGVVLGFHLLQGMVTPYADSLKNTSIQRFISVIPGIGQGAAAISQMVMGSGVLIKNTMGSGAIIALIAISLIPLMKLVILLLFYQGAAAILQPVCDERMVSCINAVGNGCKLLLRTAATSLVLFAVSLAIICMSANVTYYAG